MDLVQDQDLHAEGAKKSDCRPRRSSRGGRPGDCLVDQFALRQCNLGELLVVLSSVPFTPSAFLACFHSRRLMAGTRARAHGPL